MSNYFKQIHNKLLHKLFNKDIKNKLHSQIWLEQIFSIIYIIFISLPIFCKFNKIDLNLGLINERRNLASLHAFNEQSLNGFLRNLDEYLKDNIPLRQLFLTSYIFITENLLKSYEINAVTGKQRELFYNNKNDPCLEQNLGIFPYSIDSIEWLRLSEAGKYAFFYSQNIPYLLFTVPDKATLYPEKLPFYTNWISHHGWYEDITDSLNHANIPFFVSILKNFYLKTNSK